MATKRKFDNITMTYENLTDDIRYLINKNEITSNNFEEYIKLILQNFGELFDTKEECINYIANFIYSD